MAKKDEELKRNTDQILQEIRIVLPGTQALMGFQFIAFFNPVFQSLSQNLKNLHFITLLLTISCTICLIAPVAFQQIGEDGQDTRKFLSYTRKMLSAGMMFLLLAITGDVFLAGRVIGLNSGSAILLSLIVLSVGVFFWYVYALIRRNTKGN